MILKSNGNIQYKPSGVDAQKMHCFRCSNRDRSLFHTFLDTYLNKRVTYCLNCINLGRSDSARPLMMIDSKRTKEACSYHLDFSLSEVQQSASKRIVEAVKQGTHILLYAVTGAGKTEITFEAIKYARNSEKRVAFVSPRIDVVKEIHLRLTAAFKDSEIELMYSGVKVEYTHSFTVCTAHQLYNYIDHFDVIIVDEYDAFPLQGNPQLLNAIDRALSKSGSVVIMTATPTKKMIRYVGRENVVSITRRYHGKDLAVPNVIYTDINKALEKRKTPVKLFDLIRKIQGDKRRVLVFVPRISMLKQLAPVVEKAFENTASVYSADAERYGKVEMMRQDDTDVLLTTTILERGVTFNRLDVIVVQADEFKSDSLIQICGRVGRKTTDPVGNIYFLSSCHTGDIRKTIKVIRQFNRGKTSV